MKSHCDGFLNSKARNDSNPYLKPVGLNDADHFNYMAVALFHLKGNEVPSQAQIDYAEREIEKLFSRL